jgi:diketogulonate reductase-like aldo/keto reductase
VLDFDYLDLFLIHWLNRNERTGPDPDTFDAI